MLNVPPISRIPPSFKDAVAMLRTIPAVKSYLNLDVEDSEMRLCTVPDGNIHLATDGLSLTGLSAETAQDGDAGG